MLIFLIALVVIQIIMSGMVLGAITAQRHVMEKLFFELETVLRQKINGFLEVFRKSKQ